MNRMILLVVVFVISVLSSSAKAEEESPDVVINADTPWIVSEKQPEPMERALDDVKSDWYKVFGRPPVVLSKLPDAHKGTAIYLGQTGQWREAWVKNSLNGAESFVLGLRRDQDGRNAVVATGADMRGSMYSAYALSEEILGVNPWYYWVDKPPARRSSITIPDGLDKKFGPPTFKYRGWFINDEDLLNKFSSDPLRENVFSLAMYDRIYETLLRLRGNMIVPATFPFPDERCQELASRRGLVLNMHHILAAGLNTYRWPKNVPYSFDKHPEVMEQYWQKCIDAFKNYEVVWTVGYRGKYDHPFWQDEPALKTPESRGDVITRAMARQVEMIRKVHPKAEFIANMWSEGAVLYHQGFIKLPEGVTVVWPDGGEGIMRDKGKVQAGQGIYYHTAMQDLWHNQLTEMVSPGLIYNQIGRFVRAGATSFFLVNVSDIRPVPLSTDCVMRMAWNAEPYLKNTDQQNLDEFLADWSTRQFGSGLSEQIAAIYDGYFKADYMKGGHGEHRIHTGLTSLYKVAMPAIENQTPLSEKVLEMAKSSLKFSTGNREYMSALYQRAEPMLAAVSADRRDSYQSHVLTQIQIQLQSFLMLESYCQSILAYGAGDKAKAILATEESVRACNALTSELHKAERGHWSGWYMGERLVGLNTTYDYVRTQLALLKGELVPPVRRPLHFGDILEYQNSFSENFPLLYPK